MPHSQLVKLQRQGFLPPADLVPVRAGLASFNGKTQAEDFPNPSAGERVCFVPYLLRGMGFPIHPFLRGLLEYYGLQLHNFTPASVLHIAGYVALCELCLGCEADNTQVQGIIIEICKGGSDKYGVSNPQGAKGKINILSSPICH